MYSCILAISINCYYRHGVDHSSCLQPSNTELSRSQKYIEGKIAIAISVLLIKRNIRRDVGVGNGHAAIFAETLRNDSCV